MFCQNILNADIDLSKWIPEDPEKHTLVKIDLSNGIPADPDEQKVLASIINQVMPHGKRDEDVYITRSISKNKLYTVNAGAVSVIFQITHQIISCGDLVFIIKPNCHPFYNDRGVYFYQNNAYLLEEKYKAQSQLISHPMQETELSQEKLLERIQQQLDLNTKRYNCKFNPLNLKTWAPIDVFSLNDGQLTITSLKKHLRECVCKTFFPNSQNDAKRELDFYKNLNPHDAHAQLLKYNIYFGDSNTLTSYLLIKTKFGNSLEWHIQNDPEFTKPEKQLDIFLSLTRLLKNMHKIGIMHLDISPTNILVCKSDQGALLQLIAPHHQQKQLDKIPTHNPLEQGINTYWPPYLYRQSPNSYIVTEAIDVYSLAITFTEILLSGTNQRWGIFAVANECFNQIRCDYQQATANNQSFDLNQALVVYQKQFTQKISQLLNTYNVEKLLTTLIIDILNSNQTKCPSLQNVNCTLLKYQQSKYPQLKMPVAAELPTNSILDSIRTPPPIADTKKQSRISHSATKWNEDKRKVSRQNQQRQEKTYCFKNRFAVLQERGRGSHLEL